MCFSGLFGWADRKPGLQPDPQKDEAERRLLR
jgi:hypothetical protein